MVNSKSRGVKMMFDILKELSNKTIKRLYCCSVAVFYLIWII